MKKIIFYILFISLVIFSCKKEAPVIDSDQSLSVPQPTETIYEYLNNYNGEFMNGWMPEHHVVFAGCPDIIDVSGNSYVIPGGNNKLYVQFFDSENDVTFLHYGVVDAYGYYRLEVPPEENDMYSLVIILSQMVKKNNFIIKICLEDSKGNISLPYYLPVVLKSAQSGDLQISLSFDQHNDLDLHVIEPDGFVIYWGNTLSPNGGILDLDANANCVYDSVNNENVFYTDSVPLGTFKVQVWYYKQCIPGANTNFTVTALYNGQPVSLVNGSNPFNGTFPNGYEGYYIQVMTFDVGNIFRIAHFQFGRYGRSIVKQEIETEKPPE
ncbi:MAG: hypothetical protein V1904_04065 [Bacteroidota bacterium]